ncbi:hypothetical protein N9938_02570, partial [Akkermansiaceae bacterium]|nr:hypothetical protein [Akkermansiaceae bacterium]
MSGFDLFRDKKGLIRHSISSRLMPVKRQNGSEWKEWLSENAPRLLAYAQQRCDSMAEAEDMLQDSLI